MWKAIPKIRIIIKCLLTKSLSRVCPFSQLTKGKKSKTYSSIESIWKSYWCSGLRMWTDFSGYLRLGVGAIVNVHESLCGLIWLFCVIAGVIDSSLWGDQYGLVWLFCVMVWFCTWTLLCPHLSFWVFHLYTTLLLCKSCFTCLCSSWTRICY